MGRLSTVYASVLPHREPARAAAFTPCQRRCVLALLLAILLVSATLHGDASLLGWLSLDSFWMGHYFVGLPFLLAAWAALSPPPLATRLPQALGAASMLALVHMGVDNRYPDAAMVNILEGMCAFLLLLLLPTILLAIMRRRRGWRVLLCSEPSTERWQFSLRQLVGWLAGTAVVLSLARWLSPESAGVGLQVWLWQLAFTIATVVLALPLFPALGAVLGERRRLRRFGWSLAAVSLLDTLVVGAGFVVHRGNAVALWESLQYDLIEIASAQLGALLPCYAILGVFRLCGYRLTEDSTPPVDLVAVPAFIATPSSDATATTPRCVVGRDRRFVALTGTLILVLVALLWAARAADWQRWSDSRDWQLAEEWRAIGVHAWFIRGELHSLDFPPGAALSDGMLQRLRQIDPEDRLERLELSGRPVTDEQLRSLSELKNLRSLSLDDTAVTDAGLVHLLALTNLEELDLSGTAVTDKGMDVLARMPQIAAVGLDRTAISDAGLARLGHRKSPIAVFVWQTKVTAQGVESFSAVLGHSVFTDGISGTIQGSARLHRMMAEALP